MSKKILITGISGFAGSFLAEHLVAGFDVDISGTFLSSTNTDTLSNIKEKVNLVELDLMNGQGVEKVIAEGEFDSIFHLAALTSPAKSFENPAEIMTNNVAAQVNILEAVRKSSKKNTRILVVSSAEVYGLVKPEDLPIDEETSYRPVNPYAVSKLAQDFLGLQYALSYNLDIVRARPFNHIGPRQSPQFVVSSFCKQIAEAEKNKKDTVIKVGNIESKRDFSDVRDMVRAYVLLMEHGVREEVYNIGSGISHTIADILSRLLSYSSAHITIQKDESLLRPSDTPDIVCDSSKISKLTGWKVEIPLEKSLKDTLDYWRNIV